MKTTLMLAVCAAAMIAAGCGESTAASEKNVSSEISSADSSAVITETAVTAVTAETETQAVENDESSQTEMTEEKIDELNESSAEAQGILTSADDLCLYDTDGGNANYAFTYADEEYYAYYTPDNWKIVDSYKINSKADMLIICEALSDIHPLHGSDGVSFREPEDMAYEWIQHNIAFKLLPEGDRWKDNAKDVDLNPADQGKSIYQMYKDKTGGEPVEDS